MSKRKRDSKERFRRILRFVCGLMAVLCLGYFALYCYMANDSTDNFSQLSDLIENRTAIDVYSPATVRLSKQEDAPEILEKYRSLYAKNKSVVGWISIEGTPIDYPVMQSKNEDYYLDHNFEQKKDNNGSIFIDTDCSIWPRSENIIIYGHNMKSGKMFGSLKEYKNKSYYDKHPYVLFDTLYDTGMYQVMYVFNEVVHEETEVVFKYYQFVDSNSSMEFNSNMEQMAAMSLYDTGVKAYYGDSLITLSTCDYSAGAERFVVVCKKID